MFMGMTLDLEKKETYTMGVQQDPLGLCHICEMIGQIKYCPICKHWFCRRCRSRFFARGLEFVKELIKGKQDNCCGPMEEDDA